MINVHMHFSLITTKYHGIFSPNFIGCLHAPQVYSCKALMNLVSLFTAVATAILKL